jgi:hypothetical protein
MARSKPLIGLAKSGYHVTKHQLTWEIPDYLAASPTVPPGQVTRILLHCSQPGRPRTSGQALEWLCCASNPFEIGRSRGMTGLRMQATHKSTGIKELQLFASHQSQMLRATTLIAVI